MRAHISILLTVLLSFVLYTVTIDDIFFSLARSGDVTALMEHLQKGVDVSSRDSKGNTAMIIAAGRGHVQVIKALLSFGANAEDATIGGLFDGKTSLMWAVSQGRKEAVSILTQSGVDVNRVTDRGVFMGKTALCWAASQGRAHVVSMLLAAGADTDYASPAGNFRGKTALMWASSQGRLEAVAVLLAAGAKINKGDYDGVTALMWASGSETSGDAEHKKGLLEKANKGDILADVVSLLLSYRASIDARDKDGITAIMYASYHGHDGVVRILMRSGADLTYRNKAGQSALQLAEQSNHHTAVEAISKAGRISDLLIPDLIKVPTCGWLLSIFRSYSRHKDQYRPSGDDQFSVARSCPDLNTHGLDGTIGELVEIVIASSVDEVIEYFGEMTFANKAKVKADLNKILKRIKINANTTNFQCYESLSN